MKLNLSPDEKSKLALSAVLAAVIVGGLFWMAGLSQVKAQLTIPLPLATSTTVGTTSAQIIAANPTRKSIQICNPSSTTANVCNAAPLGITPTTGATATGVPIAAGACFTPPSNVGIGSSGGGAGAGWNGICNAASQTLIVLEWF